MSIHADFRDSLNFRDLGGLKTKDGKTVKYGYFYRGAGLNFFTKEELDAFKKLKIKTIMDLRSNHEMTEHPDPVIEGVLNIQHSGLTVKGGEQIDWSPDGMRKTGDAAKDKLKQIEGYYRSIALDNEAYRVMVNKIVEERLPIYFHCASGKDRTGVGAIIIGFLLNVKLDEIKRDYLLSNEFLKEMIDKKMEDNKEGIEKSPELKALLMLYDGVREETFDIIMDSIFSKYSTYEEYLEKEFNLDINTINYLREKYTE